MYKIKSDWVGAIHVGWIFKRIKADVKLGVVDEGGPWPADGVGIGGSTAISGGCAEGIKAAGDSRWVSEGIGRCVEGEWGGTSDIPVDTEYNCKSIDCVLVDYWVSCGHTHRISGVTDLEQQKGSYY